MGTEPLVGDKFGVCYGGMGHERERERGKMSCDVRKKVILN